jgi:hypothetical protein
MTKLYTSTEVAPRGEDRGSRRKQNPATEVFRLQCIFDNESLLGNLRSPILGHQEENFLA